MEPVVKNEADLIVSVLLGPTSLHITHDNVLYHAYLDQPNDL